MKKLIDRVNCFMLGHCWCITTCIHCGKHIKSVLDNR